MPAVAPEEMHPALWERANEGYARFVRGQGPDPAGVYAALRTRSTNPAEGVAIVVVGALFGGATVTLATAGPGAGTAVALLGGASILLVLLFLLTHKRGGPRLTVDELERLAPHLPLSELERAYADAFFAVVRSPLVPPEERSETLRSLRRVLEATAGAVEPPTDVPDFDAEIARLETRVLTASDEEARRAFAASLAIARERRASVGGRRERAEAQRELARQGLLQIREAFRGDRAEGASTDPEGLRALLGEVRAQADATERALAELRA